MVDLLHHVNLEIALGNELLELGIGPDLVVGLDQSEMRVGGEQPDGDAGKTSPGTDVWALGVMMYELLTGTRPFRAGNLQKLLHQIVFATPPR